MTLAEQKKQTSGGASSRGSHRLALITECPRAWYFHNVLKLNIKDDPAYRRQGTLIHLCLAYHYAGRLTPVPAWRTEIPLMDALNKAADGHSNDVMLALDAYRAFVARADDGGIIPVAVEDELFATVGEIRRLVTPDCAPSPYDNESISFRADLLGILNGRIWNVDTKSTLKGRGEYLPKWNDNGEYALKWQLLIQTAICKVRLGDKYAGNIILRIKRKPPYESDRNVVACPPGPFSSIGEAVLKQVMQENAVVEEVKAAVVRGEDLRYWRPLGHFWNCYSYGTPCDYRAICLAESRAEEDAVRESLYRCGG